MLKIDLFIGLNDKDSKTQKHTLKGAKTIINNALIENGIDYYTLIECQGVYMKEIEKTIDCMIVLDESLEGITTKKLNKAINRIKKELNQESIMFKKEKTDVSFL